MKNRHVLEDMLKIFGYPKKDWMGYEFSKKNYISYHHIQEKRNGGTESIENGALLSRTSHLLLHRIEQINYDLYLEWQQLFIDINIARKPLDEYDYLRIAELKKETKDFFVSLKDINNISFIL